MNTKQTPSITYDLSVLGLGYKSDACRTGVFRVVENLAKELASREDCRTSFCCYTSPGVLADTLDYWKGTEWCRDAHFIVPQFKHITDISIFLRRRIGRAEIKGLHGRILRSVTHRAAARAEAAFYTNYPHSLLPGSVLHSPWCALPTQSRKQISLNRFITIYDLIPVLYPEFFRFNLHLSHELHNILRSITDHDWVLCISQHTKDDLCQYLNLDPSRVLVTYLAASPDMFSRCQDPSAISAVREKYHIADGPYILSVNSLEPRKNIDHSLRCFGRLVREQNINDLQFVLVGGKLWDYERVFDVIEQDKNISKRIIVTGYVPDDDLAPLYSGAQAFVYPSLYEGFGLPVLEAMQCGVPVITSNRASLPEVVGKAGILVDPTIEDELCQGLLRVYRESLLREELSQKGLERSRQFTWKRCADETVRAYNIALNS